MSELCLHPNLNQNIVSAFVLNRMCVCVCVCVFVCVLIVPPGSELVEAEKQGIHIVASPYTIHLKNSPQYFNPTRFFQVVVKHFFTHTFSS